jgi:Protein of unknown function (DUF4435)
MTSLDLLRAGRESYAVKWREFLRIFTRKPTSLICIFEGQDAKYYRPRIEMIANPPEWEVINSGGKDVAVKLYELISSSLTYSKAKTAFFFDRDFELRDKYPTAANVYLTPCYSIENLYVTESVMRRILRDEFGMNEHSESDMDFDRCIGIFNARFAEFLDAVATLNAWIIIHRKRERESAARKLNLGNLNLNNLIIVDIKSVKQCYTLFDLEAAIPESMRLTPEEVGSEVLLFERASRQYFFRGKFQIYFMRVFLTKLRLDCSQQHPTCVAIKRSISFSVGGNILSELSPYAETPDDLRSFLASLN